MDRNANGQGGSTSLLMDGEGRDIAQIKAAARAAGLAARAGRLPDEAAERALQRVLLDAIPDTPGAVVSAFWPLADEIDLRPLLHALSLRGQRVALPVTTRKGNPLTFRLWHPGITMLAGRFGTLHPDGSEAEPDILIVPLLAFDRRGYRLGYGGGYYDRTLAGLPCATAIGCAMSWQEVAAVPIEPTDISLARIATERGVIVTS